MKLNLGQSTFGPLLVPIFFFTFFIFAGSIGLSIHYLYVVGSFITSLLILTANRKKNALRKQNSISNFCSFVITLWLFTPFIRRIGDYHNGWSELNIYGMAPIVCTLTALFFINFRKIPKNSILVCFGALALAIIYSYLVGIITVGLVASTYAMINWVCPIILGAYISSHHQHYSAIRDSILKTCSVSLLIIGVYGVVQYLYLPEWDAYWISNVPMTSVGSPLPMSMRVFSTLNSPMIFAPIVAMLIIFVTGKSTTVASLGSASAIVAMLLSFVRAAWGGLAFSFAIVFLFNLQKKPSTLIKYLFLIAISGVTLSIFLTQFPVGERLLDRIDTLNSLQEDTSFNERQKFYLETADYAASNFLGDGMGAVGIAQSLASDTSGDSTIFDSGILQLPITLGWFGTFTYCFGLYLLMKVVWRNTLIAKDPYRYSYLAITASALVQMVFSNRLNGPIGIFFFLFIGLSVCSYVSARSQRPASLHLAESN